jgi:DNA helicase IV
VDELRKLVPLAAGADLDAPVTVLTVTQAKGLEFDAVVLVDPAAIMAESPRGLNDLYVALTRSTQRLCIVYSGELPSVLATLAH